MKLLHAASGGPPRRCCDVFGRFHVTDDPLAAMIQHLNVPCVYPARGRRESSAAYRERLLRQGAEYRTAAEAAVTRVALLAEALVRQSPVYRDRAPGTVAEELLHVALEHAFAGLRAAFTKATPKGPAVTDRQALRRLARP